MNTAFLFTGQGAQYYGMYEDLSNRFPRVKETFDEISEILKRDIIGEYSFEKEDFFKNNENNQIMMFSYALASFRVLRTVYEIEPQIMAGHSLGAVRVIQNRGRMMDKYGRNKGSMLAVMDFPEGELAKLCKKVSVDEKYVAISNINSSRQIVVSGNDMGINELKSYLDRMNFRSTKLNVNIPFHSIIMKEAARALEEALIEDTLNPLKYPIASNIDAKSYRDLPKLGAYLGKHIVNGVKWRQIIEYLVENKVDNFVEIGPKPVLTRMLKSDYKNVDVFSVSSTKDMENLEERLPY